MSAELKPCPFCGGTDIKIDRHIESRSPTGELFTMCCYDCGATFPGRYRRELLVNAWNKRVDTSKPTQSWIPVSERLPENEGTYFCLGHNGTPFVCLLRNKKYEGYVWLRNTGTRVVDGITHWMPIPSLQEQNK